MNILSSTRSIARKTSSLTRCRQVHHKHCDPLRILFCGSDAFSAASLQALQKDQRSNASSIIESIDVLCRPGKRVGRGLTTVRNVPIAGVSQELGLPLHEIDSFEEWQPPVNTNLVVAVSFGLFIPSRILRGAKYGGLNVHPSFLPDLRGPAPLHHALLLNRPFTGVTLQTLHPSKFDHGDILAQSSMPGIHIDSATTLESLLASITPVAASLLLQGINDRVFVPPTQALPLTRAHVDKITDGKGIAHAPKITPEDRRIDWKRMPSTEILRRDWVLKNLWDTSTFAAMTQSKSKAVPPSTHSKSIKKLAKRIIFSQGFSNDGDLCQRFRKVAEEMNLEPGTPMLLHEDANGAKVGIRTVDGVVVIKECTVEGGQKDRGVSELLRLADKWS